MSNQTTQDKFQQAFIAAVVSLGGIPEEAVVAFMNPDEDGDDGFCRGKYGEYYTTLADCYSVWRDAIQFERGRCYSICEHDIGTEGDGQNCADAIAKQQTEMEP